MVPTAFLLQQGLERVWTPLNTNEWKKKEEKETAGGGATTTPSTPQCHETPVLPQECWLLLFKEQTFFQCVQVYHCGWNVAQGVFCACRYTHVCEWGVSRHNCMSSSPRVQFLRLIHLPLWENFSTSIIVSRFFNSRTKWKAPHIFQSSWQPVFVNPQPLYWPWHPQFFEPQKQKKKKGKCWHSDVLMLEMSRFFTRSCFHSCACCVLFKWDWLRGFKRENLWRPTVVTTPKE